MCLGDRVNFMVSVGEMRAQVDEEGWGWGRVQDFLFP